jgi:signal transduction histidine kinase
MILWPIIKGGSDETKSRAVGVVRCVLPAPNSRDAKLRLDDDKAVIEMIATQMAPVMDAFNSRIETDRLLAVTRHDLLAPLVMIEHAVDTLAEMVNAPEHSETTSRIRKDAEVAFLMVRNLVPNLTILSPPEEKFAPKVSSIAEVLAGLNRPLTHYAKENSNIILQFDDFSDCPAMMLDQALISLALFHLITNAIKYGDPGSTVYVSKAIDENSFLIHVTNYGLGIEEQEVPYLFRANYRGTRAIRAKTGQGLGLNSAKRALSLHGGDIRLTKLNNPTVFSVLLPKALAHSAQSK